MTGLRVKSHIDFWLSVLIWLTIAILIGSIAIIPQDARLLACVIVLPVLLFLFWIYFGTYYELREDHLFCKSGPFYEKIPYDNIKSAKLSRNLLSSLALSTKRIEIKQHGKGYITGTTYISPVNREDFLQQLVARCRNLQ